MEEPQKMAEWEFELLAAGPGDTAFLYGEYEKVFSYIEELKEEIRTLPKQWEIDHVARGNQSLAKDNVQLLKLVKAQAKFIKEMM